jgi:flagellar hook-associated protein 3 FlgL
VTLFRVTERSIASNVLTGLQGNITRLSQTQERLSNGKLISKPSDSPTGTVAAMQYRTEIAMTKQYGRNADDGIGWLGTADTALTTVVEQVHRVRELVLQGMSAGSASSPAARSALATEIDNIRAAMIGHANSTYLDRPIFGGTTAGALAYDIDGNYVGDTGTVERRVADNMKVRVDTVGVDIFGTGSNQLFAVLKNIADNLRGGQTGVLGGDLDRLDVATTTLQSGLSGVGARYNQLTRMRQVADNRVLDLSKQLSDIEDIDLPQTLTELQLQQTAYQAALAAGARVVQPSLMDFLR